MPDLAAEEAAEEAAEAALEILEEAADSMEEDWAPLVALARAEEADAAIEETSLAADEATEEPPEARDEANDEAPDEAVDAAEPPVTLFSLEVISLPMPDVTPPAMEETREST